MLQDCVVLNGQVINIGPWDYQIQPVLVGEQEVSPAEYDAEGNLIKEAVMEPIYEDQITNPFPGGVIIEQRDVQQDADGGWYVTDAPRKPTTEERLKVAEDALTALLGL